MPHLGKSSLTGTTLGADDYDTWGGAFALYAVAALVLGCVARPLAAALACTLIAAVLALTSTLSIPQTAALLAVPFAGAWLAAAYRWALVGPDAYLAGALLPVCGLAAVYTQSWAPTAGMLGLVCASPLLSRRLSPRATLGAGLAPTLLTLATVLTFYFRAGAAP